MKRILITGLLYLVTLSLFANYRASDDKIGIQKQLLNDLQDAETTDYVIADGEIIFGKVKVDLESNTVEIEHDGVYSMFFSSRVEKACAYDINTKKTSVYYSGVFGLNQRPFFFKSLSEAEGSTLLLYRKNVKFNKYEEETYGPYFVMKDKKIYALGESKKEILGVFDLENQKDISDFVKSNKLNLNQEKDLIELFEYNDAKHEVAVN